MIRHTRTTSTRAFTLIELVVALGIVAIMSVSMYASVRIAFKAQTSAETAVEPSRTAELAMDFVRQDLQNAVPPAGNNGQIALATGRLAGDFVGVDGTGNDGNHPSDDLLFYSTADAADHQAANGEIKRVELLIITPDKSSQQQLVRRVTRNLLASLEPAPDEEVLVRGIAGFNLRYYDGTTWQETWDSTALENALPKAIEVTIELDRPTADGAPRTLRFTRVFTVSCATPPVTDDSTDTTGGT
jgi:type II secretion system protein J